MIIPTLIGKYRTNEPSGRQELWDSEIHGDPTERLVTRSQSGSVGRRKGSKRLGVGNYGNFEQDRVVEVVLDFSQSLTQVRKDKPGEEVPPNFVGGWLIIEEFLSSNVCFYCGRCRGRAHVRGMPGGRSKASGRAPNVVGVSLAAAVHVYVGTLRL
ncbi:hypothetical protein HAX54_012099 [Datura stramonium]|uniref:Uncharacterized protein n=1 Tax=Datura stramonium TaxID=4076 RepID=A0ABS8RIG9_DATST|nr:hypothetical protein [Datura stramonium]